MKVIHWNVSRRTDPVRGAKRYEDELFSNIERLGKGIEVERMQRAHGKYIGSVFVSWFVCYRCRDADIVHATFQTIAPVAYLRKPKRFIVTVLDLIPVEYPSTIRDVSTRIQWLLTPRALTRADRIIAISEFTRKEVIRIAGVDATKIDVVYPGVDHSKYYPMNKEECKKRFHLDLNDKHILVVAANEEHKRMDLVRKVYVEISKQREDVKLIKIGYGEGLQGEGIINLGWIAESEMPALFNAADVLLHTSEYEGFGLPVLEAMACGIPVVVSNKASIPEVVGGCGDMVDIESNECVGQFAEKILKNIDGGRGEKAIEWSNNFSWERTAEQTIRVYEEVAKV